jgi:hypothetical protein
MEKSEALPSGRINFIVNEKVIINRARSVMYVGGTSKEIDDSTQV